MRKVHHHIGNGDPALKAHAHIELTDEVFENSAGKALIFRIETSVDSGSEYMECSTHPADSARIPLKYLPTSCRQTTTD